MSLLHGVYDTDTHYIIDGVSRAVTNLHEVKNTIMQYDHNSERLTFELPRMIDGHDLTQCNAVRVHFININTETRETHTGLYVVDDLKVSEKDENTIVFSWLIDGNATQFVGPVEFNIRFLCVGYGNRIDYAWNTAVCSNINVSNGINADETYEQDYSDIIAKWQAEVITEIAAGVDEKIDEKIAVERKRIDELVAMRKADVPSLSYNKVWNNVDFIEGNEDSIELNLETNGLRVRGKVTFKKFDVLTKRTESWVMIPEIFRPYNNHERIFETPDTAEERYIIEIEHSDEKAAITIFNQNNFDLTLNGVFDFEYDIESPVVPEIIDARVGYDKTEYPTAGDAIRDAQRTAECANDLANNLDGDIADHERRIAALEKNGTGEGYTTSKTDDYALAISDADGNIVAGIKPNGETVGNFPDKMAREKLSVLTTTPDYAYAVCDEDGNVVFAITHDGEVQYVGKGEGGGTAIDLTKCGLTILYLNGDTTGMTKDDAVTLNAKIVTAKGTAIFNGTCTCKWQGSSSVRNGYPKRNYTIKFDTAFEATKAVSSRNGEELTIEPWGEQKKYCLKANWIDPSNARNVVNAKLWGEVVASRENVPAKLAAAPNYGAIDGFPCIIVINGEFSGLYTFNIPKDGWMFGMGDGTAEYVVGGESNSESACGFYSTPTFVDEEDFAIEHIPDGVADETLIASFQTAVNAVKNAPNSADWETAVAPYIDIQSAIDYYIFTCCISGHDNLRKNALYATYDGVKWFMSAYDLDTTLGSNTYGTGVYPVKTQRTQFYEAANGSTKHRLFELIYKYSFDKLKARYWELRNTVLSNENVWYMFNNFVNAIPRAVYNMDAERWADKLDNYKYPMPATTTANMENYIQYYRMHTALLDKEMED